MRYLILLVSCVAWGQAWYPSFPNHEQAGATITNQTIDAANEKIAFCGFVWTPAGASKSIRNVGIRTGSTITKSGGSGLTVSLQDISTSAGVPIQPDGTQDQTVAVSNANIPAVSTWYTTGNLSADRSVAHGDPLCVVTEFDGSGWQASDVITLSTAGYDSGNPTGVSTASLFTGTWAASSRQPLLFFVFSDGTYGSLDGSMSSNPGSTVTYNSSTAGGDEYSLKFVFGVSGSIDGVMANGNFTSSDFDIVLYNGTTALTTKSIDANWVGPLNSRQPFFVSFPKTSVTAGVTYYLSVKPTTTTNLTLVSIGAVSSVSQWNAMPTGQTWHRAKRVDSGAWTDETTERPAVWVRFTADTSSGTSGGAFVVTQ